MEIPKTVLCLLITSIIFFLIGLIVRIPEKLKEDLNEALKTHDEDNVKEA
jgi:hypothetical protein